MLDRPQAPMEAPARPRRDAAARPPDQMPPALNGAALLAILRRRKLSPAGVDPAVPAADLRRTSASSPRATPPRGTLLYDAAEYKLRELQSILRVDPITDAVMATQAEVLRGMPVVEQVASAAQPLYAIRNSTPRSGQPPWWRRRALLWHVLPGVPDSDRRCARSAARSDAQCNTGTRCAPHSPSRR